MATHRPKWHRIKCHRSYMVDEAARTLGVCKESIRRWRKTGLKFVDDQKSALIRGQDLKAFGKSRAKLKQKCRLHECYCFRCKTPKEPAGGMADFVPMTATNGNLKALCKDCHSVMCKRVSNRSLPALKAILDITVRQAGERLGDSADPCANVDLKRGDDQ